MDEIMPGLRLTISTVMVCMFIATFTIVFYKAELHDELNAYGKVVVQLRDTPVECVKK